MAAMTPLTVRLGAYTQVDENSQGQKRPTSVRPLGAQESPVAFVVDGTEDDAGSEALEL